MRRDKSLYSIRSVELALDVLEQFAEAPELTEVEIGSRLKIAREKTLKLISTLESYRYLEKNRTGKYSLGQKNLQLGQTFHKQMGLLTQARPVQESLVRRCKETTNIAVRKEFDTVYLDAVETDLPVRVVPRLGANFPLYCTAAGKVLAAAIDEEKLNRYLVSGALRKYTSYTICDPEELLGQLRSIAALGYAVEIEEMDPGVTCVGAPIRDRSRQVVGAVTVTAPSMRVSQERLTGELIPMVMEAGQEISASLGYF